MLSCCVSLGKIVGAQIHINRLHLEVFASFCGDFRLETKPFGTTAVLPPLTNFE